jgi:exodeoxyribonuclease VIII
MIAPGIYTNMTNEEYHNDKDSISRSKLLDLQISPYNYWALHLNPNRPSRKSSVSMDIGQAYHDLILQPELFSEQYATEPKRVLLKDSGRESYDNYKSTLNALEVSGKKILSSKDHITLLEMWDVLKKNTQAFELISGATYEQSHFWINKETGLLMKCRPDILHRNMVVDFKTTKDASRRAFQNAIAQYGYHIQSAIIQDGIRETEQRKIDNFIFVCQEKIYPYQVGIYILDEEALDTGHNEYKALLSDLNRCIRNNCWPGLEPQNIGLPRWADR